jgi:uncharacterized membrane protein
MDSEPIAPAGNNPAGNDGGVISRGLVEYTHWIYGLHALSVLIGLLSARSVATRFAFGLPSIIAVIMNYARRSETHGTWLETHFRWQIRTFWFSWLWILVVSVVAAALLILLVGFVIAVVGYALIGAWIIYRVARGWLALREGRPMPLPSV